jgi:hypothetical protein
MDASEFENGNLRLPMAVTPPHDFYLMFYSL